MTLSVWPFYLWAVWMVCSTSVCFWTEENRSALLRERIHIFIHEGVVDEFIISDLLPFFDTTAMNLESNSALNFGVPPSIGGSLEKR